MIVWIQQFQKFMYNTSRDIIRYFSTVASEDTVGNIQTFNHYLYVHVMHFLTNANILIMYKIFTFARRHL